jgi:glycosyltransferase involved in cell wall biosynthesis
MKKQPLLFVSDAISSNSGLARITRDLATRVHNHLGDIYRVGTAGYGGPGSRCFPWPDYHFNEVNNWLLPELPAIAEDFAAGEELTIMFVWDASRLYWLGIPAMCPMPHLRRFAERKDIKKYIYGAIDAEGPNGKLPNLIVETYKGFDRVLDYSEFSSKITGHPDHLPHGVDPSVFHPFPQKASRAKLAADGFTGLTDDTLLIGVVATNQARKNWPLAFQTAKILLDRGLNVRVWAHVDSVDRYWSIGNLVADYGLHNRVAVTTHHFSDVEMAQMYSACDVTLGVGSEGFGFPIMESLACGVPSIVGSYGGQSDFVPPGMQVDPISYFYDGAFCSKRPVHAPEKWADKVEEWENMNGSSWLPGCLDWNGLWPRWKSWFREGAK